MKAAVVYLFAYGWFFYSFIYDFRGYPASEVDLFPRSGAVLVLVAFWLTMVVRPKVEEAEFNEGPNYAAVFADSLEEVRNPEFSPKVINRLSIKLHGKEVFLGTVGTLTWAYGDLFVNYVASVLK